MARWAVTLALALAAAAQLDATVATSTSPLTIIVDREDVAATAQCMAEAVVAGVPSLQPFPWLSKNSVQTPSSLHVGPTVPFGATLSRTVLERRGVTQDRNTLMTVPLVLHYRMDLLLQYNFTRPPLNLDELQIQAHTVVAGEAAKGHALHGLMLPGTDVEEYDWRGVPYSSNTMTVLPELVLRGLAPVEALAQTAPTVRQALCSTGTAVFGVMPPLLESDPCNFPVLYDSMPEVLIRVPTFLSLSDVVSDELADTQLQAAQGLYTVDPTCATRRQCLPAGAADVIDAAMALWGGGEASLSLDGSVSMGGAPAGGADGIASAWNATAVAACEALNVEVAADWNANDTDTHSVVESAECKQARLNAAVVMWGLLNDPATLAADAADGTLDTVNAELAPCMTSPSPTLLRNGNDVTTMAAAGFLTGMVALIFATGVVVRARRIRAQRVQSYEENDKALQGPALKLMKVLKELEQNGHLKADQREVIQSFTAQAGHTKNMFVPDLPNTDALAEQPEEVKKWILSTLAEINDQPKSVDGFEDTDHRTAWLATQTGSFKESKFDVKARTTIRRSMASAYSSDSVNVDAEKSLQTTAATVPDRQPVLPCPLSGTVRAVAASVPSLLNTPADTGTAGGAEAGAGAGAAAGAGASAGADASHTGPRRLSSATGRHKSRRRSSGATMLSAVQHCILVGEEGDHRAVDAVGGGGGGTSGGAPNMFGASILCVNPHRVVHSPLLTTLSAGDTETRLATWGAVDIVELAHEVGNDDFVLPLVMCMAVNHLRLVETLNLDPLLIQSYADAVCSQYLPECPYHNSLHAADVCHSMLSQLVVSTVHDVLAPLDCLAGLLAAAVHDVGHSGQSNHFHVVTNSDLAIWFSDKSCLEHFHLAVAFTLMRDEDKDVLAALCVKDRTHVRSLMIDMVLATDLAHSLDITNRFKMALDAPQGDDHARWLSNKDGVSLMLQMALKLCDIGHSAKPLEQHIEWSRRVTLEFFAQGQLEADMGLAVSPLCDVETCDLPKSQIGFLQFVAMPTFKPWVAFTKQPSLLSALLANKQYWERESGIADPALSILKSSSSVAPASVTSSSPLPTVRSNASLAASLRDSTTGGAVRHTVTLTSTQRVPPLKEVDNESCDADTLPLSSEPSVRSSLGRLSPLANAPAPPPTE